MNVLRALAFGSCLAVLMSGVARAAEPAAPTISIEAPAPLPAVLAAAQELGIPTDRNIAMAARPLPWAGDFVEFLASVREGPALTQWIVRLTVDDLTPAEQELPPLKEVDAYSSAGTHLHFSGRRAAVEIDLIGPFADGTAGAGPPRPTAVRLRKRVLVNADYLALGFDRACEATIHLREALAGNRQTPDYAVRGKPFSSDRIQAVAPFAREIGLTPERERARFGAALALPEFLRLVIRTPGLQDILQQIVDVSWWSIIRKGGRLEPGVQLAVQAVHRLPPAPGRQPPLYRFPLIFTLNRKAALECLLVVTEPRPPMTASAGVILVAACRPSGTGPQLTIELLAARPAEAAKPANPPGPAREGQAAH